MDMEKVIKEFELFIKEFHPACTSEGVELDMFREVLALLKEQEERLRKLQKDKDKLCLEVSEWKHKFHDTPPKFVSQGVVDQICWERDTALSQLEQIGKGLGSKMDDIVALLKEQEEQKQKWLQSIADNQLANAPKHDRNDFMSLDEHMEYQYQLGVYDGLQMAWDILTEGR